MHVRIFPTSEYIQQIIYFILFWVFKSHILYVIYYDRTDTSSPIVDKNDESLEAFLEDEEEITKKRVRRNHERQLQIIIFFVYLALMLFCVVLGYILLLSTGPYSPVLNGYAVTLGIIGVVAVLFQFTPQIYVTYKIKVFSLLT